MDSNWIIKAESKNFAQLYLEGLTVTTYNVLLEFHRLHIYYRVVFLALNVLLVLAHSSRS